ncbi:MAG: hypothetical protein GY804_08510 [Alphaproteobacteria bacterium]|nr:hypothetical protein [Alphaproteobacteria bacterium]
MSEDKLIERINRTKPSRAAMFTEDDLKPVHDPIKRIIIKIIIDHKIDQAFIKDRHDVLLRKIGIMSTKRRQGRVCNYIRMLKSKKKVTWRKLIEFLQMMEGDIVNLDLTVTINDDVKSYKAKE